MPSGHEGGIDDYLKFDIADAYEPVVIMFRSWPIYLRGSPPGSLRGMTV